MYRTSFTIKIDCTKGGIDTKTIDDAMEQTKEQAQKIYNNLQRTLKRNKYHTIGKVTYMVTYEE